MCAHYQHPYMFEEDCSFLLGYCYVQECMKFLFLLFSPRSVYALANVYVCEMVALATHVYACGGLHISCSSLLIRRAEIIISIFKASRFTVPEMFLSLILFSRFFGLHLKFPSLPACCMSFRRTSVLHPCLVH